MRKPFRNTQEAFGLDGETALITGGGTGLGFAMAQAFVASGCHVVLAGRRETLLAEAVARLGPRASHRVHDVSRHDQAGPFADSLEKQFGFISIVVNNAGIHLKKAAVETTEAEFSAVLDTHLTGAFAITRRLIPAMAERRHGSILFIASMTALFGMPHVAAYSAAKSACVGLTRSLACELAPHGIRVNAIAPGWIDTPMLREALARDPERERRILSRTPQQTFGSPEDVAWAAVYLCSPAARFLDGVVLPVDGGASIGF
ncbi:MAG: SDR family oxidoreductase [Bryobacteraceae bacterium]|nr:SDR family oxidoreductase [Bryobacteraceae bacterium]